MTDQAKELGSDAKPDHVATPQQADHDPDLTLGAKDNGAPAASDTPRSKQYDAGDSNAETGVTGKPSNDPATEDDAVREESGEQQRDATAEENEEEDNGEEDDEGEDEDEDVDDGDEDDEEEDEDEEPSLKISRLTPHLNSVYRNGDATSAFLVAGDKMVSFHPNALCI